MQLRLTIVRGLPGSGKSTTADALSKTYGSYHCEADMFQMDQYDNYDFSAVDAQYSHGWCLAQCARQLKLGRNVVVSNTFITMKRMWPYVKLANDYNAECTIINCTEQYGNVHDVPEEVIERMTSEWEDCTEPIEVLYDRIKMLESK